MRTNVHFEAVIEYFTTFDVLFTAETAGDFNDSTLSAVCFPHSSPTNVSPAITKPSPSYRDYHRVSEAGNEDFATSNGKTTPIRETHDGNHTSYDSSMVRDRSRAPSQFSTAEDAYFSAPQIETTVPSSVIHEYDLTTASEQETDDDVIQELPCEEDDVISLTSSYRTFRQPGGSMEYVHRQSGSDYLNQSIENFEQLRPKVKLFPRPVTNARATRPGTDGVTRSKLPAGLRRPSSKNDQKHSRSSKTSRSPISQKSRHQTNSLRHLSAEIGEEFPTMEDAGSTSVRVPSPPMSVRIPMEPHLREPVVMEPAIQDRSFKESVPEELVPQIPVVQELASPSTVVMQPPAIAPTSDFALLPRRPTLATSPSKPWLTRAPSYGDSTFSVLSTEKQRLMRVLELRKKTLSPLTTSNNSIVPAQELSTEPFADGQYQQNGDAYATAVIAPPNTGVTPRNPSMDFMHRLVTPSSQNSLPTNPEISAILKNTESVDQVTGEPITPTRAVPAVDDQESTPKGGVYEGQTAKGGAVDKHLQKSHRDKRRTTIEPIRTGLHYDHHDDESESDYSLLEELHNAKVEEAKPMSFAQSPRSPLFSSDRGDQRLTSGSVTSVMIHSPSRSSLRQNPSESLLNGRSPLETIPSEMDHSNSFDRGIPPVALPEPTLYASQLASIPDEEHQNDSSQEHPQVFTAIPATKSQQLYDPRPLDPQPAAQPQSNSTTPKRPRHANALLKDAVHTFYNVTRLTKAQEPRDQVSVTKIERKTNPSTVDSRRDTQQAPNVSSQYQAFREPRGLEQPRGSGNGAGPPIGDIPRRIVTNELPRTRSLPQPAPPKSKNQSRPTIITTLSRQTTRNAGAADVAKPQRKTSQVRPAQTVDTSSSASDLTARRMAAIPATTRHPPSQQQAEYLRDQTRASSWPQIAPPAVPIGTIEVQLPDTLVSPACSSAMYPLLSVCSRELSIQLWKRREVEVDGSGFLALGNTIEEVSSGSRATLIMMR